MLRLLQWIPYRIGASVELDQCVMHGDAMDVVLCGDSWPILGAMSVHQSERRHE